MYFDNYSKDIRANGGEGDMIHTCVKNFFDQPALLIDMFQEIEYRGGACARILTPMICTRLLQEAERYPFFSEAREQGTQDALVYQELETFHDFPFSSDYLLLKDIFEVCLAHVVDAFIPYPFSFAPLFNSTTLTRYPKGSIGISPHRDPFRYKNLICIFILGGKGKFYLCTDRSGKDALELDASPGNIILLRCPGFKGINKRPFHFLSDIEETRYSFILRQEQIIL